MEDKVISKIKKVLKVRFVLSEDKENGPQISELLMLQEGEVPLAMLVKMVGSTEILKVFEGTQKRKFYY